MKKMWEREWGLEEVESKAPSLCLAKGEEYQGYLGGGEGLCGGAQMAL